MRPVLVLDTNIILLDHNNVLSLGRQYQVFIPDTVIEELDSKKSTLGEIGYQARAFNRLLSSGTVTVTQSSPVYSITQIAVEDVVILVIAMSNYPEQLNNDRRIIHATEFLQRTHPDLTFMSNDIGCRLQALAKGIKVIDLKEVEQTTFEFTKYLEVDSLTFSNLHNTRIIEVDPDYRNENFNYVFYCPVEDQSKVANIFNGTINIVGRETEAELRRQDINPIGAEQLLLSRAIQHDGIDLVLCEARAGTGL